MKSRLSTLALCVIAVLFSAGCASHQRGFVQGVRTPVRPGVTVGKPLPYGKDGQVAISVVWTASQKKLLKNKAEWWIEYHHKIPGTGVFDTGEYTLHFGPCKDTRYYPPDPWTHTFDKPNKLFPVTVRYGRH